MKYVILTGMSGAGKSSVLKFFEDIGYFCVDNLPPSLIPKFTELCDKPGTEIEKVAIGIDIRGGKLFDDFFTYLSEIKNENNSFEILFLDCSDKVLLKRYKETRRRHPLAKGERLITGIIRERELLSNIRKKSDYIIDTSHILSRQLKQKINDIFLENKEFDSLMINVLSFGFKYGIPSDADLVFDVRFLPNPFYIDELKPLTGNDILVHDYVMKYEESKLFLNKLLDMINFLIPNYIKEGKNQLVIAIGCTGGKHRSVTLANELYNGLNKLQYSSIITHRDIDKDSKK
ncbi:RNase adapter RapZ [uncultured Tyzzerella sp.]|uniref:RNase adapter RapZ n=1 Tax=uncultured Tyzzerella sp. TaxID=2321398 RepID=UPI002941E5D6|nr:RNase adapter RapZ [uncultured Tyzzerella sp.]